MSDGTAGPPGELGISQKDLGITVGQAAESMYASNSNSLQPTSPEGLPNTAIVKDNSACSEEIQTEIKRQGGKIPFSKFMEIALYGQHGYYSTGRAEIGVGEEADFSTYSEKSHLFGVAIGESIFKVWEAMKKPIKFDLIEMGAGEGALAKTMLEWSKVAHPEFYQALRYHILEFAGGLIPKQRARVTSIIEGVEPGKVNWVHGSAYHLPFREVEGVFISNELPDAFPVDIVRNIGGQPKQKYVSITTRPNNENNDQYVFTEAWDELSPEVADYIRANDYSLPESSDDMDFETVVNFNAARFQQEVDAALRRGAILTIDYGSDGQATSSIDLGVVRLYGPNQQDYTAGKDEYLYPGRVDITTDVDFQALAKQAERDGLGVVFTTSQAEFVESVGGAVLESLPKILATKPSDEERIAEYKNYAEYVRNKDLRNEWLIAQLTVKGIDPDLLNFQLGVPITETDLVKAVGKMGEQGDSLQKAPEVGKQ